MADKRQDDPSPLDPSSETSPLEAEQELSNALTEAASKVVDLMSAVGSPATDQDHRSSDDAEAGNLSRIIDSQLAEIDRLIGVTSSEVGTEAERRAKLTLEAAQPVPTPSASPVTDFRQKLSESDVGARSSPGALEKPARPVDTNPPAHGGESIPDFMAEFTTSDSSAVAEPEANAGHTLTLHQASRSGPSERLGRMDDRRALRPFAGESAASLRTADPPMHVRSRPLWRAPLDLAISMLVAALNLLDRPFRGLSGRTKEAIGWLALIALFAAGLFYLISFF